MPSAKQTILELLSLTDIQINGNRPFDIQVHNERFYERVLAEGELGIGESYMDGDWDCEALDVMLTKALTAGLGQKIKPLKMLLPVAKAWLINRQRKARAYHIGEHHYDIGNDLYHKMLDRRLNYSCAYWKNADNLDEAQEAKLDLICRKVGLKPGMTVLDIGCGWGSFASFAAEKYGARVTGITVSKEQIAWAQRRYQNLNIDFQYLDYRLLKGKFDRIVSVGMFEHVGPKNYRTFLETVHQCLADDGLCILHTIGANGKHRHVDPWTDKYIFPGGALPSMTQITKAAEGLLTIHDWHVFGQYYDNTLMAWHQNYEAAEDRLEGYDERFQRMWRYYLLSAAASFRAGRNTLWQIVFAKPGERTNYVSVR
jgi:cyclopropane-fatty-acyl-phospholipid synthase